jgi:hypothetical protein
MLYLIFSVAVSLIYYTFSVAFYLYLRAILLIITMPPKRAAITSSTPRKRVRVAPQGTYSQPIVLKDSQQSQRLSPRKVLVKSRLSNDTFESELREAVPEGAIVAPDKASEAATVEDGAEEEGFNAHLKDNFKGLY